MSKSDTFPHFAPILPLTTFSMEQQYIEIIC